MNKWFGEIGFANPTELKPGIWEDLIIKRNYYGDVIKNSRRLQSADQLNDNINISNEISILSDPYAIENFHTIKYAMFMGTKWKVNSAEVQYPRLVLSLGGVYHGQE